MRVDSPAPPSATSATFEPDRDDALDGAEVHDVTEADLGRLLGALGENTHEVEPGRQHSVRTTAAAEEVDGADARTSPSWCRTGGSGPTW